MQSLSVLAILLLGASHDGSSVVSAFSSSSANKINRIRTRTGTSTSTSNAIVKPSSTTLFLEDHIADLIDRELVRVGKLKEWEAEFTGEWCWLIRLHTPKHAHLTHCSTTGRCCFLNNNISYSLMLTLLIIPQ